MAPAPKPQIAAAFTAAAELYDAPPLRFFDYFGERTVAHAALRPGEVVLDVCCGTGAWARRGARAVAPGGRVIGVDLTPAMLALARAKAAAQGVANVEFRHADFDQAYFRPESFDAVICAFGLFFFPDMPAALRKMWRFLRPGGRLLVTTWGAGAFEPASTLFLDALRQERPDLADDHIPRTRLSEPGGVEGVFAAAGIAHVETEAEDHDHTLASAEDWWTIVMGSAHRGRVDQLPPEQRERVRQACLGLTARALRMPVVYTVARR
jgi:ubiquinone/menaquinone biosynthesis C-methylase UbiE